MPANYHFRHVGNSPDPLARGLHHFGRACACGSVFVVMFETHHLVMMIRSGFGGSDSVYAAIMLLLLTVLLFLVLFWVSRQVQALHEAMRVLAATVRGLAREIANDDHSRRRMSATFSTDIQITPPADESDLVRSRSPRSPSAERSAGTREKTVTVAPLPAEALDPGWGDWRGE